MSAVLACPLWGDSSQRAEQDGDESVVTVPVKLSRATWTRNNHNHADELSFTVDYRDAGVDPRLLGNATVEFYLGNADENGNWKQDKSTRRFMGIVTEVERANDTESRTVDIRALDFTALMLQSKPFPPDGVPLYTDNLQDAWARIVDHAGGKDTAGNWFKSVELLADRLKPIGVENWPPSLSKCNSSRIVGAIPINAGADAWAVWSKAVGMLGLISWIDQDDVIVTTATNLYTRDDPPVLVWGKNILSLKECRICSIAGKKIALVAYDPLTGRVVQALYPGLAEKTRKKVRAKSGSTGQGRASHQDDYDVFEFNGVTDADRLMECAKRVYEERSRQELTGTLTTAEMFTDRVSGEAFDLLTLGAGQDIRIELEQQALDGARDFKSVQDRIDWLMSEPLNYSQGVAELIARNADSLDKRSNTFHTQSVTTTLELDDSGGSFSVEIGFCNRIEGVE